VRHEVSKVRSALRLVAAAGLVLLVVAGSRPYWRMPGALGGGDLPVASGGPVPSASVPGVPAQPTPHEQAMALVQRARQKLENGDPEGAHADLAKSYEVDPGGDGPEAQQLATEIQESLNRKYAKPGSKGVAPPAPKPTPKATGTP
jgi:hypothetical protein